MGKVIFLLFILLLFFQLTFAQEEGVTIPTGELDTERILEQSQQNILQTSQLSTKIDLIMQKNVENLEVVVAWMDARISELQSALIIITILMALSALGLWWSIFLYLQSKSLISFPKTEKLSSKGLLSLTKKTPKNENQKSKVVEQKSELEENSTKELLSWMPNNKN